MILTFSLENIFLDVQRNSMKAVTVERPIPKIKTRNAPATFAKVKALAVLGAFRKA